MADSTTTAVSPLRRRMIDCQSAPDNDPGSASNIGSDSILMKLALTEG